MELLNAWKSIGITKPIQNVTNKLNPVKKEKDVYEISLFNNWLMIDLNLVTKNHQFVLKSNKEFISDLIKLNEIYLIETTMNEGLHLLISFNNELKTKYFDKEIILKNGIKSKLRVEFKKKCLIYPSNLVFKRVNIKILENNDLLKLLKTILKMLKKRKIMSFKDTNIILENDSLLFNDNINSDFSGSDLDDDYKKLMGKKPRAKKLKSDTESVFQIKSESLAMYHKQLYKVYLNYKQHFVNLEHNEFYELQKNLEKFIAHLDVARCSNIYFNDLVLFILSILYEEYYPSEKDHPFYELSTTEKWIEWTNSYLNLKEMLDKNNASLSYRINIKIDGHELYRAVTCINEFGSNMTDDESKQEFINFREKFKLDQSFQPNLAMQFISFILTTLSLINLNLGVHYSVNNYLKMNTNFKAGIIFYIPLFKRYTSKFKMQIIKCFSKKHGKSPNGYIFFKDLYWQSIYNNSDFFDNLISTIFASLTSHELESLKAEILLIGNKFFLFY